MSSTTLRVYDQVVKVWDMSTGRNVFEFSVGTSGISTIAIDDSGKRYMKCNTCNYTCILMNCMYTSETVLVNRLVTGSPDGQLKVWNYNSGECLKTLDKGC